MPTLGGILQRSTTQLLPDLPSDHAYHISIFNTCGLLDCEKLRYDPPSVILHWCCVINQFTNLIDTESATRCVMVWQKWMEFANVKYFHVCFRIYPKFHDFWGFRAHQNSTPLPWNGTSKLNSEGKLKITDESSSLWGYECMCVCAYEHMSICAYERMRVWVVERLSV